MGGGRSLSFDDAGDARVNTQYGALDMSFTAAGALPAFTASAWFNTSHAGPPTGPTAQNFNWAIIDFDRSDYFNVYVRDTDGGIGFSTAAGAIHDQASVTTGLNDGAWHHVAVVYDGTDKQIYIDGVLDSTAANPHGGAAVGTGNDRFGFIGDGSEATVFNGGRNDLFYDGSVDDIAIWSQALTGHADCRPRRGHGVAGREYRRAANFGGRIVYGRFRVASRCGRREPGSESYRWADV